MPWRVPRRCNAQTDGLSGNARNRLISVLRFFFANAGSGRSCVACAHVLGLSSLAPGLPLAFSSACPTAHTGSDRMPCARVCMPLLCTGRRVADRPSLQSCHHPLRLQGVALSMSGRETRSHAATQPSGSRASGSNCTFCGGAGHTDSACPQRLQHQRVHSEHFPSSNVRHRTGTD